VLCSLANQVTVLEQIGELIGANEIKVKPVSKGIHSFVQCFGSFPKCFVMR